MNERAFPLITAILILLLGIFILLAVYLFYNGRGNMTDLAALSQAPTSTPIAATPATSAPAVTATPKAAQVQGNISSGVTKSAVSPATLQASVVKETGGTKSEPSGRPCTANDLSGMASWERTGAYLTGTLRVKNSSTSECVLSKNSRFSVYSGTTFLTNRQTSEPSASMSIPSGSERLVRFTWSNWCGNSLRNPGYAVFTLPGSAGYLRIPFIDSDGDPQFDAPQCGLPASGSSLDMWW
jgi:hypothetical protein